MSIFAAQGVDKRVSVLPLDALEREDEKLQQGNEHYQIGGTCGILIPNEILTDDLREKIYLNRLKKFDRETKNEEWDISDMLVNA